MIRDEPNLALAMHQLGSSTQELDGKFNSLTREGVAFYHAIPGLTATHAAQIQANQRRQIIGKLKSDLLSSIQTWPFGDQYDFESAR